MQQQNIGGGEAELNVWGISVVTLLNSPCTKGDPRLPGRLMLVLSMGMGNAANSCGQRLTMPGSAPSAAGSSVSLCAEVPLLSLVDYDDRL